MNKLYAICIASCNIIDQINNNKLLEKCDLVQVIYTNEQNGKCSLKLLSDDITTTIKFAKHIYWCDLKNIRIVPHKLLLFLIGADYLGRLNILHNEKYILDLRMDSHVTLKFIDDNKHKYSIEFVIDYIGAIDKLGIGNFIGLNFAYFESLRDFGAILTKIHERFYHKCDELTSVIMVRVEQLFCEILLSETHSEKINNEQTQISQLLLQNTEQCNLVSQNLHKQSRNTLRSEFNHNKKNVTELNIENFGQHLTKGCVGCYKLENLFTFPCNHAYCYNCLLGRLDNVISSGSVVCPNCGMVLKFDDQQRLHDFLDLHLSELTKHDTNNKYMPNDSILKNEEKKSWPWSNKEKKSASNDKGKNTTSGGNKIESLKLLKSVKPLRR